MSLSEKGRAALASVQKLYGRSGDPFATSWAGMTPEERKFWVSASRLPGWLAARTWVDIPQEYRDRLKNNLYRAAKRAEELLRPCLDLQGGGR